MPPSPQERLVNLTVCLLAASEQYNRRSGRRVYVTREYIRLNVEGYQDKDDSAFRTMFERDKANLRRLGIPIQQGPESSPADEQGYYLSRSEFEFPQIEFTPEEQAVLGVAARVWRDGIKAEQTAVALAKLRTLGIEPGSAPLDMFLGQIDAKEPAFDKLSEAAAGRRTTSFTYRGEKRRMDPWALVSRYGSWYVIGYDHDKREPRVYKLSRIDGNVSLSIATFMPPDPSAVSAAASQIGNQSETRSVTVLVKDGYAPSLLQRARCLSNDCPKGYQMYEVEIAKWAGGVGELCSHGPNVVAIAPDDVREAVIRHYQGVVSG